MVGLIVFANQGGLGIQTKRLYEMLKPDKVLLIDSRKFSKNKRMNWDWYPKSITTVTDGFPNNRDVLGWIPGLKTVLTVENPYNFFLIKACRDRGIKTIVQSNYEFNENVYAPHLPIPDLFLMPSYWKLKEMEEMFGKDRVMYLPPPIDPDEFHDVFWSMTNRKFMADYQRPSFLHVVGTLAHKDRNGTLDLLRAVKRCKGKFYLTIHSQHELPPEYIIDDPKITYRIKNFKKNDDIYVGFNGLILPRRYGGLSLTTNEALMSGIPVMMTDISPNNKLLPKEWLVPVRKKASVQIRMSINTYSAYSYSLAKKIDEWAVKFPSSKIAYKLGLDNFSVANLEARYRTIL